MWCNYFFMLNKSIYNKLIIMSNKQRLFEMMERLNPEFKNEEITPQPIPQGNQVTASGDVANLQKAVNATSTVQYADSRIDTPQELQDAFGNWISRTGYSLNNKPIRPISISMVQTLVKNAMQKLGYK
jgi:hypothetical protein